MSRPQSRRKTETGYVIVTPEGRWVGARVEMPGEPGVLGETGFIEVYHNPATARKYMRPGERLVPVEVAEIVPSGQRAKAMNEVIADECPRCSEPVLRTQPWIEREGRVQHAGPVCP